MSEAGLNVLGWREVPVDPDCLGRAARASRPVIRQLLVGDTTGDQTVFERRLLLARKLAQNLVRESGKLGEGTFHLPSLSGRTIVYKGLMLAHQVPLFYRDLVDPELTSALALVHQRYSTNTFPSWELAQPFRTWPTTARSIPCAATSTGPAPARPRS